MTRNIVNLNTKTFDKNVKLHISKPAPNNKFISSEVFDKILLREK